MENIKEEIEEMARQTAKELDELAGDYEKVCEYLDEALDINYVIGRDGDFLGAEICLGWGGPSLYVDTKEEKVKAYWGFEHACYPLSLGAMESIDSWAESLYECVR